MPRKPATSKHPKSGEQDKLKPPQSPAHPPDDAGTVDDAAKIQSNPAESPLWVDRTSDGRGFAIIGGVRMPKRKD